MNIKNIFRHHKYKMWYETQTTETTCGLDKSTIMKMFNTHFFEFMDDIISIFPDNLDIKTAKNTFDTFRRANPTSIIKVWYKYVHVKYRDLIEQGDISYFLEKDYAADLTNVKNPNKVLAVVDSLRQPLRNMGEVNKAHSVKYIQNLCRMSNMYIEAGGTL